MMKTINQTQNQNFITREVSSYKSEVSTSTLSEFWQTAESNRFAVIPMILAVVAIMGGLGAAAAVQDGVFKLAIVALTTSFVEAIILAERPMRTIVIASIVSVALSTIVAFL